MLALELHFFDEAYDPAGGQQLDHRPAWDTKEGADSDDREPCASVRKLVAVGELVGQRPTDPEQLAGLFDRQQERVLPQCELEVPNDAHKPYLHSCDSPDKGHLPCSADGSARSSTQPSMAVNGGQPRTTCCDEYHTHAKRSQRRVLMRPLASNRSMALIVSRAASIDRRGVVVRDPR